jgi:hypothetical protein
MAMVDDYLSDRFQVLLAQECTTYMTSDYLAEKRFEEENVVAVLSNDHNHGSSSVRGTKKRRLLPCTSPQQTNNTFRSLEGVSNSTNVYAIAGTTDDEEYESRRRKFWREKMCEWAYQGK